MHYLLVHTANEWSGTARAFTAAARGLAARGHDVTIAVEPDSTVEQVVSQEASGAGRAPLFEVVPFVSSGSVLAASGRLRSLARRSSAEAVFVHTDHEHLLASLAFRLGSRAPVVRRVPVGQPATRRRSGRVATWLAPTCFMFTTDADLQSAALSRRARSSLVAPLGVNIAETAPLSHEGVYTGEYIVCVHDASSRSCAAAAIRTVAMLVPWHPDLQLVITGEGGYEEDLRMQAAALGILNRVTFLGDRADELLVMQNARLGWVLADADTAAYGMLDLMALGVPTLGAEGTIAERYILSNITGLLFPPDDPYLAAAGVAGLLASDPQRERMGHAARARVAREFHERAMLDGFERAAAAINARQRHRH